MTTFEMAQKAYENPGKVFVGRGKEPYSEVRSHWADGVRVIPSGNVLWLEGFQKNGYVWEEERTPRKWSGEYTRNERGWPVGTGVTPFYGVPGGVKARVKWEAEEVL